MISKSSHPKRKRSGQIAVLIALSLIPILGMLALSVDGGGIISEKRHAQNTADSCAIAAASQLYYDYWVNGGADKEGTAKGAALTTASKNGYTNDGVVSKVTVNIPPQSGIYVGRSGYAEVIVEYNYPPGFSSIFGSQSTKISARAVALGAPIATDVGILVLDRTTKDALSANGGGTINVTGAPVINNSLHQQGTMANGGTLIKAPEFNLSGNYATVGGGAIIGPVNLNCSAVEDPLQYLPAPDPSKLTVQAKKKTHLTNGNHTLNAGVYKGGISASGTAALTLNPGIYYMDEGGFSFSGQGSLIAAGVLIYNAPGNGNADGISITGQGVVQISPMTSGIYQGMSLWQERTSTVKATVSGGGESSVSGTFYFPNAQLNVSGNGSQTLFGSQYISKQLNVSGGGTIDIYWDKAKVARRRMIALVE